MQHFLRGLRQQLCLMAMAASLAKRDKDWFAAGLGIVVFILVDRKKDDPILFLLLSGVAGLIWYGS